MLSDTDYRAYLNGAEPNPVTAWPEFSASPFANVHLDYRAPGPEITLLDNFENPDPRNSVGGLVLQNRSGLMKRGSLQSSQDANYVPNTNALVMARLTWQANTDELVEDFGQAVSTAGRNYLSFRVGQIEGSPVNAPPQPTDFSVVLVDENDSSSVAVPVSFFHTIGPPWLSVTYPGSSKQQPIYSPAVVTPHSFMEVVRIPLTAFCETADFDITQIKMLRFVFNSTQYTTGDVAIDEIHFST